jgi:uncharacterized membrane protein
VTHLTKNITIQAPAEKIFAVLIDPERASEMNPDLKLLSYTPAAIGGHDNTWEYKMGGMTFNGETRMKVYDAPRRAVYETSGGIPSTWEWSLAEIGDAVQVSLSLDYTMPGSLLGAIANKLLLERQNEKVIENQLANLKRMAES